jgi:uroporphyrinogen-III synthase
LFFCGNRKREELPNILIDNKVNLSIIETYNTNLNFKKINTDFEAIMFFSPSAIESYTKLNKIKNETIFTIGETTSKAAQKYSNNIITAKSQSIEEVVKNVIKYSIND